MPAAEVPDEVWQSWRTDAKFATEGGECFGALDARVRAACDELAERISGEDVVVVSHVSPIKAAVAWALNTSLEIMFHCHLAQASVCRVGIGQVRSDPAHVQRTGRSLPERSRAQATSCTVSRCEA